MSRLNGLAGAQDVVPGTKPPHKSEMFALVDFFTTMLKKNGVGIKFNLPVTIDMIINEEPYMVLLATGSAPIVPTIPGVHQDFVLNAEDALMNPGAVGDQVVVIGGGSVGVETAELLEQQGKKVTVVEMSGEVLSDMAPMLKAGLLYRVGESDIVINTGEKVQEIGDHQVITDKETLENVDTVVLAIGYQPDNALAEELKDSKVKFKVIGDAVKPRKIYDAVKEGFEAAAEI